MIRKAVRYIWSQLRAEGQEEIETPRDVDATFVLQYNDLTIGTLRLQKGIWRFAYSAEFRKQSEIQPLVSFPDTARVYESKDLWPFFMARIPGLSQPEVQETIRNEKLDEHNSVDLLKRFGERTISNPFVLLEKTA